jgi:hypothetical protein
MSTAGREPVTFSRGEGVSPHDGDQQLRFFDLQRFFRSASSGDVPSGNP